MCFTMNRGNHRRLNKLVRTVQFTTLALIPFHGPALRCVSSMDLITLLAFHPIHVARVPSIRRETECEIQSHMCPPHSPPVFIYI